MSDKMEGDTLGKCLLRLRDLCGDAEFITEEELAEIKLEVRIEELEQIRQWLRNNTPSNLDDFTFVTDFAISLIRRVESLKNEREDNGK